MEQSEMTNGEWEARLDWEAENEKEQAHRTGRAWPYADSPDLMYEVSERPWSEYIGLDGSAPVAGLSWIPEADRDRLQTAHQSYEKEYPDQWDILHYSGFMNEKPPPKVTEELRELEFQREAQYLQEKTGVPPEQAASYVYSDMIERFEFYGDLSEALLRSTYNHARKYTDAEKERAAAADKAGGDAINEVLAMAEEFSEKMREDRLTNAAEPAAVKSAGVRLDTGR